MTSLLARLRPSTECIALMAIVVIGGLLRLQGIDWDQGHHLHPDERFLTMVANAIHVPESLRDYFATHESSLNPVNVGYPFFVYGTLPVFFVKALAALLNMDTYAELVLVGRVVSALFDCGTIVLTWWLGRRLGGPSVALFAAALMSFSVVSIQSAHFFTVDSAAAFFAAGSIVGLIEVARGRGAIAHVVFAVAFALAVSCRINLALIGVFYTVAAANAVWTLRRGVRDMLLFAALAGCVAAVVFRIAHPYAFAGPGFFDVSPAREFVANIAQVRDMVTGKIHFPPANQWIGRTPLLYAGTNLFFWGLGPAWGLTAIAGVLWCLARRRPVDTGERQSRDLGRIAVSIAAVVFVYHAVQFVPTLRYFLPVVPIFAIAASWLLGRPHRWCRWARVLVLVGTATWALAFTAVYRVEHSRVQASRWIHEHVPAGSTITVEHWDDSLPLPLDGRAGSYEHVVLGVYDEDSEAKRDAIATALDASDYVILSSPRAYRSIPRSPWRYPLTTRYYELLFAEELGFRLERVFTSYPKLGPVVVVDDTAEEQFTVYDHPKVLVFAKRASYSSLRVRELLDAVALEDILRVTPADASSLYRRTWPTEIRVPGDRLLRYPRSLEAALMWVGVVELNALSVFAILFPFMSVAKDRGFALAKVLGWLAPAYLVFIVCSLGVSPSSEDAVRAVALALWAAGGVSGWRHRGRIVRFVRENVRSLMMVQSIFWIGFALFGLLRALNGAVFWGEKPMDFAILNAIYRSSSLPPVDPWFAGEFLNYHYFGHLVVACLGRLSGVPPALAFNLGMATVGALVATGAFAAGRQLAGTRSGVLATVGAVVLGNLAGLRLLLSEPGRRFDFNFFWETSRVIDGTINEFPFWSLLFGDLHAHVLALPFDIALLYVASLSLTAGTNTRSLLLIAGLASWLAGASNVTSMWNLPVTAAIPVIFLAAALLPKQKTASGVFKVAIWGAGIALSARVLFLPFWTHYQRSQMVSFGWESSNAPWTDVLTIFGVFLLVIVPALLSRARALLSRHDIVVIAVVAAVPATTLAIVRSPTAGAFAAVALLGMVVLFRASSTSERAAAAMVVLAASIGLMTETVYVSDRMNTVFKFYLHIWLLFALAAAVLLPRSFAALSTTRRRLWALVLALATAGALFTSVTAGLGLLRHPIVSSGVVTLDGMRYLVRARPGEWEAFRWMEREIRGVPVILEAQGPSYQLYSRVSMNTGLPTVLGWESHLKQQNRDGRDIDARRSHVRAIYETTQLERALALMDRYAVDFIFVGPLERETYNADGLAKFENWAEVERVFHNEDVTIYGRPGAVRAHKTWVQPVVSGGGSR